MGYRLWGHTESDMTEAPHERLPEILVVPREKTPTGAAAKSLQLCLTLCNPIDGSPLGSSVPGILQARILEWVAISFSNA